MNSESYEITSLNACGEDDLYAAHVKAFKDYPFQWSRDALFKTMRRRGFNQALSFGAFYKGELIGFTFNGVGDFAGVKSVYDTGTGTAEEHRGRGLASGIFQYSIPFLKSEGYRQYVLEVLCENEKAYSVYKKQGFEVSRVFDCFRVNSDEWIYTNDKSDHSVEIAHIGYDQVCEMSAYADFPFSWQNSLESVERQLDAFVFLGAFKNGHCAGYGVFDPESGDVTQLAVDLDYRRQGIGSRLLSEMRLLNKADSLKVVNVDAEQKGIVGFIERHGIPKIVSQYEMIYQL